MVKLFGKAELQNNIILYLTKSPCQMSAEQNYDKVLDVYGKVKDEIKVSESYVC